MKKKDRLTDYIRGEQKGKAANSLEREALSDPFLFEALEGFSVVSGEDTVKILSALSGKIKDRVHPGFRFKISYGVWAAVVVIAFMSYWFIWGMRGTEKNIMLAQKEGVAEKRMSGDTVEQVAAIFYRRKEQTGDTVEMKAAASPAVVVCRDKALQDTMKPRLMTAVRKSAGHKPAIKVTIEQEGGDGPLPIGGITAFEHYLSDSLVYPEDALQDKREGYIKLSFIVNKNGRPSRIRVVHWITYSCNREAIRLLDKGPAWTYTGSTELTYLTIPFRLPETDVK